MNTIFDKVSLLHDWTLKSGVELSPTDIPYVDEPKAEWLCKNCGSTMRSYVKPMGGEFIRVGFTYKRCEDIIVSSVLDS